MTKPNKLSFRDVDAVLQYLRNIFLGRKHTLHNRFMPFISSRTIPPPDIPRSSEIKLANNYYHKRSAYDSVWPPIVAPIAEGPAIAQDPKTRGNEPGGLNPNQVICLSINNRKPISTNKCYVYIVHMTVQQNTISLLGVIVNTIPTICNCDNVV